LATQAQRTEGTVLATSAQPLAARQPMAIGAIIVTLCTAELFVLCQYTNTLKAITASDNKT